MKQDEINVDTANKCEEGAVYASSIGMFGDDDSSENDITEIKSMNFKDLEHEISTENKKDDEKAYVFIRNVHSVYINPLKPASILNKGIQAVDPKSNKVNKFYNHSTISASLKDGFAGLNLRLGKIMVQKEYINDVKKSEFTNICDPNRSSFGLFAVEVTNSERIEIEKMINNSLKNININYSVITDFLIGMKLIANNTINDIKNLFNRNANSTESKHFDMNKLVCSTFVAYILAKCCPKIREEFRQQPFDFNTVTPNKLVDEISECKLIFNGMWNMYDKDRDYFIKNNPKYKIYNK